ncbi:MAG: SDR family NAD(P)-dependent oxidoreductase [Planctomycetota bacterium]
MSDAHDGDSGGAFHGRLVVVTGGTGALGTAVARHVLDQGGRVAIPAKTSDDASRSPLIDDDRVTITAAGDLAEEANAEQYFAEQAENVFASIHVAGGFAFAPIEDADADLFLRQLQMNAVSCYNACRAAIGAMRRSATAGRIVNVAAKPALHPHEGANMAAYTASKAAVVGLTGALAEEVKADGIWINAVVPSIMDTPSNRQSMPDADHEQWPAVEDVAQSACWLASPLNQVTRGAMVPVYGKS